MDPKDLHGDESDNSQGEESTPAPKYMSTEEFNKAQTAREKAFEKRIKETINQMLSTVTGDVDKLLTEKYGNALVKEPPAKGKSSVEDEPVVRGFKKQIDELTAKVIAAEQATKAEQQKQLNLTLRQSVTDELMKHGLDGPRARHAVGFLVDAEKKVGWNEDGELVFNDSSGELDLATGIRTWAKSDEAKIYMPPRGSVGSGERPGGNKKPNTGGKPTKEQLGSKLLEMIRRGGG